MNEPQPRMGGCLRFMIGLLVFSALVGAGVPGWIGLILLVGFMVAT